MKPVCKVITILFIVALAGCSKPAEQSGEEISSVVSKAVVETAELNVYSARQEHLLKPLLEKFTAANGIKVNLVSGKADALLKRLESEGQNTEADLFITTDACLLYTSPSPRDLSTSRMPSSA